MTLQRVDGIDSHLIIRSAAITLLLIVAMLHAPLQAGAREFRLGLVTPANHLWTQSAMNFGNALHSASDGRHSVTVFPSQQLGNEAQMLQQLQMGVIDMAFLTVAEVSNRVPDFGAFYAPYLVADIEAAAELLRSATAEAMLEQLPQRIGVFGIGYGMAGMRQILSRGPVTSADDLRGQKLRITPFAPIRDFYQLLGAAPTPMPLASVYDALANGQVDAIDMDMESIVKLRYHELADTVVVSNHMMFPMVGLVSARVWVRLEAEDQGLIRGLMRAELEELMQHYVADESEYERRLRDTGVTILGVGAEFFGTVSEQWDARWSEQSATLAEFRARD